MNALETLTHTDAGPLSLFLEEPHLRHVETDVLIPKLMREKAKELCEEKVEGASTWCRRIKSYGYIWMQHSGLTVNKHEVKGRLLIFPAHG